MRNAERGTQSAEGGTLNAKYSTPNDEKLVHLYFIGELILYFEETDLSAIIAEVGLLGLFCISYVLYMTVKMSGQGIAVFYMEVEIGVLKSFKHIIVLLSFCNKIFSGNRPAALALSEFNNSFANKDGGFFVSLLAFSPWRIGYVVTGESQQN
jgi:hypothetical protein